MLTKEPGNLKLMSDER